ncbi:hypothetical protein LVJ82_10115 [Vitreoscilla massiliensis]|uniref:Uncharacterized protein n=1 Tax=Vitreoscilla massiliensis TaxID=1689272 RepID=A0ABY4DWF6_9NEIS|nr:Mor transcription activator family protein [Vitreoscilla massiliensis]UOO87847.1 hypothetical protein LVJ82_10115 [Vitreoscilla massiliensis]
MNKRSILTKENYKQAAHKLPKTVHEIAVVIGIDVTIILINEYRGRSLEITKAKHVSSRNKMNQLAGVIGREAATKLSIAYSTQRRIHVPQCREAFVFLRNIEILKCFDSLTTGKGVQLAAHQAVSKISLDYGLMERYIWKILKCG